MAGLGVTKCQYATLGFSIPKLYPHLAVFY